MKSKILLILLFSFTMGGYAQTLSEYPNFERYKDCNEKQLIDRVSCDVVFMGNSITDAWPVKREHFFKENGYVGRGISGQTSGQMLLRFRKDVIELNPRVVVINAGTNDIAENTGLYISSLTFDNIASMVDIALANHIKVILTSVLPCVGFPWNKSIASVPQKIQALNIQLKELATQKRIMFVDYNLILTNERGAMRDGLSSDGVHPNVEGYQLMERSIKPAIDSLLSN